MVRFILFQLLLIAGVNCLICAFLVNQQHAHRKAFGIYPIKCQQLQKGGRWHGSRVFQLSDGGNERGKDITDSSFIVDATTIGQTVPKITEELERQNQGRIYKAYQDLISYIMRTPLWRDYSLSLTMKPIVTKSFSSMIGFFVGDILAQIIFRRGGFNFTRFLRMGAFGGLIHGPTGHLFYGFLERKFPGASTTAVVKKVTIDQLVWCPIFTMALFCFTGITAGFSPREIFTNFKISGPQVIFSSWLIWPAAHAVNFRVIPGRQRLLYINIIQLFFNSILSALANNIA